MKLEFKLIRKPIALASLNEGDFFTIYPGTTIFLKWKDGCSNALEIYPVPGTQKIVHDVVFKLIVTDK